MIIYLNKNVYQAALERVNRIFDEFENVGVWLSGGKDSTIVLNLAFKVAEERGRLPLNVLFIDQEAEWQTVIDHVRTVMADPRVKPYWFQMPIRISNGTSSYSPWLHCWEPGAKWMREREPGAITENVYGTDRFHDLFPAIVKKEFPKMRLALFGGVRSEESPSRHVGITASLKYKDITWGKKLNSNQDQYTFYPIYDWSTSDVWKAIHVNKWPYCPIYDYQYQHGVSIRDMRVSNLHHETAIKNLYYLQEIEHETWNKLTARLGGINTAAKMNDDYSVKTLPFMFDSWKQYRDYLLEKMIVDPHYRAMLQKTFDANDKEFEGMFHLEDLYRVQINSILANDYEGTKINNFKSKGDVRDWVDFKKGKTTDYAHKSKYIHG